jgi:fluoride exporter
MFSVTTLLQVAAGGAIGASGRYLVNVTSGRLFGTGFPVGTLVVNVLGSFLMGVLVVLLAEKSGNRLAPFLMTGVLGGFTTFSAFSLDAITLWERGQTALAAGYVLASVLLSLAAFFLALHLFRGAFA